MIYDITPGITSNLAVWPGDTPPSREVLLDMATGGNLTLSTLRSTVHLGAHADGPNHYGLNAPSIDQRDLSYYLGPVQVVHVSIGNGQRISIRHLPPVIAAERLLLATGTYEHSKAFQKDFAAIEPSLIEHLGRQQIRLVGIDTPSVDLYESKDLPAHRAILKYDMAILEGLDLSAVPNGIYELIALPLKLVGFDASPVRAILRTLPTN